MLIPLNLNCKEDVMNFISVNGLGEYLIRDTSQLSQIVSGEILLNADGSKKLVVKYQSTTESISEFVEYNEYGECVGCISVDDFGNISAN